jgi:hypothetical protein
MRSCMLFFLFVAAVLVSSCYKYDNPLDPENHTGVTVATPSFSPAGGTYTSVQTVTVSCATAGASIRYTTNGSDPTESSTLYSGSISVSSTTTLKAMAFKANYNPSLIATAAYTFNLPIVATPSFSPAGGTYTSDQTVAISCATAGASIRYTTNGSDPTESSSLYSGSISVSSTTTLKAKAFKASYNPSLIATANYTFAPPPLTVLFPNGGETLYRGSTYAITWHTGQTANWIEIELWRGSYPYYHPTIATFIQNTGSFQWTIPSTTEIGDNYRVRIRNHYIGSYPGDEDYSDSYFVIQ